MRENFDPSKIQLDLCEPVNIKFEQDPFWFYSKEEVSGVNFTVQRSVIPAASNSNILVFIRVYATIGNAEKKDLATHSSIFRFGFRIEDLPELVEKNDKGLIVKMHQGLQLNVTNISISSMRGLLRGIYANTVFAPYFLPVLTPEQIISMDDIDLKAL